MTLFLYLVFCLHCKQSSFSFPRNNHTSLLHKYEKKLHLGGCGLLFHIMQKFSPFNTTPQFLVQVFMLLLYIKAIILNFVRRLALNNTKSLNVNMRKLRMAFLHLYKK